MYYVLLITSAPRPPLKIPGHASGCIFCCQNFFGLKLGHADYVTVYLHRLSPTYYIKIF